MAQIDTSIYGQIRPYTMESPIAQAGQALQVQALQQQVQEGQRKFTLESDISGALAESGGDLTKASSLLATRGRGNAALTLRDKAAAETKASTEQKLKLAEAAASDGIAVDAVYRQALTKHGGNAAAAIAEVQPIWTEVVGKWKGMGHQLTEQFDPQKNLAGIGQTKEVANYLKGLQPTPSDVGKLIAERDALPPNDPRRATYDSAIREKSTGAPSELGRLTAERDALPEGDPKRAIYDRVLAGYKAGRGDTNVSVNTGPMTPGKAAATKVDEGILDVTRNLMQLDTIASQFKPEFQRFQDKIGFGALKVKDSTTGLTNKEKQDLSEYSTYRRNAFNTLNEYIKSITGAAMSNAEADRILKGLPNPGSGMFDGDSPTEFKAKLDDAIRQTKVAVARLAYIKRNGMSLEDGKGNAVIPLDRMPTLINDRGKEIEAELRKAGNADAKAIQKAVRRQLGVEFGLSSD